MGKIIYMAKATPNRDVALDVGQRLARTREALGLTQEELAEQIGFSRSAVANWEKGDRLPDQEGMMRLYQRHRVPMDWIFNQDPSQLPHKLAAILIGGAPNPRPARRRAG